MPANTETDPRYPIGPFQPLGRELTPEDRAALIGQIEFAPAELRSAVEDLSDEQLDTPYREGGWTVRQLVHHVADSHMNAFIRCKLGLSENEPTIKPYDQDAWATHADNRVKPAVSLLLLECLHERWVALLHSLGPEDWSRTFRHPERGLMKLDDLLAVYAWHGRHHIAHVTALRERMGW